MKKHLTEMDLPEINGMTAKQYLEYMEFEKHSIEDGTEEYYEALRFEQTGEARIND